MHKFLQLRMGSVDKTGSFLFVEFPVLFHKALKLMLDRFGSYQLNHISERPLTTVAFQQHPFRLYIQGGQMKPLRAIGRQDYKPHRV